MHMVYRPLGSVMHNLSYLRSIIGLCESSGQCNISFASQSATEMTDVYVVICEVKPNINPLL